ncbi:MAG: inosine/xanthosine triphosphatase [Cellvibrionaceae bacterium]|jgi:inosine/xanthosine triphosphatase
MTPTEKPKKIAIGSTNPSKIKAVKSKLHLIWPDCEILPLKAPSGVSDMPLSDAECILGAKNRARFCLETTNADLGVGLEGGVMLMPEGMMLVGWVAILNREETVGLGSSARIPLPKSIADRICNGEELGPVMDDVVNEHNTKHRGGASGILSGGLTQRSESFATAVAYALSPFVVPHFYENQAG